MGLYLVVAEENAAGKADNGGAGGREQADDKRRTAALYARQAVADDANVMAAGVAHIYVVRRGIDGWKGVCVL